MQRTYPVNYTNGNLQEKFEEPAVQMAFKESMASVLKASTGEGIVANDVEIVEIIQVEARRALKIIVRFTIRVQDAGIAADTSAALGPRTRNPVCTVLRSCWHIA